MNSVADPNCHWVGSLKVPNIATPAFIYSMDEITAQMRALQQALGTPLIVVLAACGNPDVQARLPEDVRVGARCVSRVEMNIVAAWKCDHIYVGMPALDSVLTRIVLAAKHRLVIDAPNQLELLSQFKGNRPVMPVILELNVNLVNHLLDGAKVEIGTRGMDEGGLVEALKLAAKHGIRVGGVHLHGGRDTFGRLSIPIAKTLLQLVPEIERRLGYALTTINLGGGLEEDWAHRQHDFDAYRSVLKAFPAHLSLLHEVGRSILSSAGVFATRVIATKNVSGQRYAICDGSMVHAFPLTKAAGASWRPRVPMVRRDGKLFHCTTSMSVEQGTVLLGASAANDDVFGSVAEPIEIGDMLLFPRVGAYVQAFSPTHYLGYSQAGSYVVA